MEKDCSFISDNMDYSFISSQVNYHVLQIQLVDRNDNPPTFQNIPYSITINEVSGMFYFSLRNSQTGWFIVSKRDDD